MLRQVEVQKELESGESSRIKKLPASIAATIPAAKTKEQTLMPCFHHRNLPSQIDVVFKTLS
jgi:hypothetical protein